MAEIKLNETFTQEVSAFRTSGQTLTQVDVNTSSMGEISLETVNAYHDRIFQIRGLMTRFQKLTEKDAKDMDALASALRVTDAGGGC